MRRSAVKIEFRNGQPIVDAALIAPLMDLDVIGFQVLMQSGCIRTGVEHGTGVDAGRLRLTFQSPDWRVRLTCSGNGTILTTTRLRLGRDARAQRLPKADSDIPSVAHDNHEDVEREEAYDRTQSPPQSVSMPQDTRKAG
jgi:hypothetical protein